MEDFCRVFAGVLPEGYRLDTMGRGISFSGETHVPESGHGAPGTRRDFIQQEGAAYIGGAASNSSRMEIH